MFAVYITAEMNGYHQPTGGADFIGGVTLEDCGEPDPMHLMDIDIISFDSDDMNMDFDAGIGSAQDIRNPAGDSCCFSYFDWGCSAFYKNVYNPADKKKNIGLPNASKNTSNTNGRPQTLRESSLSSLSHNNNQTAAAGTNFYNLPPAPTGPIELSNPATQQQPQQPSLVQQQAQQAQQAQMLYSNLPVAPTSTVQAAAGVPPLAPSDAYQQQYMQQQIQFQQQQYMAAYQQGLMASQQQGQQPPSPYQQQVQMHAQMQQQAQLQYMQQQQQAQMRQQQTPPLAPQHAFPQQYAQQYSLQHPGGGSGSPPSRPLSSNGSTSTASMSRPVSNSSYGSALF